MEIKIKIGTEIPTGILKTSEELFKKLGEIGALADEMFHDHHLDDEDEWDDDIDDDDDVYTPSYTPNVYYYRSAKKRTMEPLSTTASVCTNAKPSVTNSWKTPKPVLKPTKTHGDDVLIEGTPSPEVRFGAGFEIDEPRREDYATRKEFLDDHKAFDNFVDAGEDCVARGLERKPGSPITKVNAIRKKVGDTPPIDVPLIGETHWWKTIG